MSWATPLNIAKDCFKARFEYPPFQLGAIDLGLEDPEILLSRFRDDMNPNFPFISIPDSVSAATLRYTRPTLFTVIMALTTRNTSRHVQLGRQFMQQVADRIYVRGERNLDLLLGIMAYSAWCYHHFFNVNQLTSLVTSAATLVADLRYNVDPSHLMSSSFDNTSRAASGKEPPPGPAPRTIEERRAFLGFWFLNHV